RDLELVRRLGAHQVTHEIVPTTARDVIRIVTVTVVLVGQDKHVEILVGLDQRIGYKQGFAMRHVVVHGTVHQHQVTLEVLGNQLVGLIVVIGAAVLVRDQQALVLLAPVVFVAAVVVIAAFGPTDLEEIRVAEHGIGGGVAAAGMTPHADTVDVDP